MARKPSKKITGPSVRFRLSCRRGYLVDQRVVRDIGERENYLERTEFEFFESSPAEVPIPDEFLATEEVECPHCGRKVKIQVAGPVLAALRRFQPCLWVMGLALIAVPLCFFIPELRKMSEKAAGNPAAFGMYAVIGSAVLILLCIVVGMLDGGPTRHVLDTKDFKHRILPAEDGGDEEE